MYKRQADDTGAGSAVSADRTEYLWDDEDAGDDSPLASVHAFRSADSARPEDAGDADARDEDAAAEEPTDPQDEDEAAENEDSANEDAAQKPRPGRPTSGRGTSRGRIADVLVKDTSEPKPGAEKESTRSKSSSRRASVPSWDEIVFGRKND